MFRNLNALTKILTLVVMLILFMISVGTVGFYYTNVITDEVEEMYNERLYPIKLVNEARANSRAAEAITKELLLANIDSTTTKELMDYANQRISNVDNIIADFEKTNLDTFEAEKLQQFKEAQKIYRTEREKALALSFNGEKEAGYVYFVQNASSILNELNKILSDIAEHNDEEAVRLFALAKENSNRADTMIIVFTTLASLFSLVLGSFIALMISKPLIEVVEKIKEVANGNLAIKPVDVKSTDEVGQLGKALNQMIENLRSVIRQVNESAEQVAASSEELSASSQQFAASNQQVATSVNVVALSVQDQEKAIDKTSTIIEQVSSGMQQIAANAHSGATIAEQTTNAANEGSESIKYVISQMNNIEQAVNNTAEVITSLGERSKEIEQIVVAISGIAAQTNLLALNAAIEAARAGEQGKGFAVVAEEVRKLAEQAEGSSKEIAQLIGEIQKDTDKAIVVMNKGTHEVKVGSEVVNKAGRSFTEIAKLINDMSQQMSEISASTQETARGAQEITSSMKELEKISRENTSQAQNISAATEEQSASMEQISSSSQSLAQMSVDLQSSINRFRV
ncbi:HAMP domain-containing protein [Heliorestis acidaminivorans]|uniref:HAMP domain-containing protein n=1 Tax=Heliorestis acidaminivorans TaxID=553427 RepID=A0A6I0EWY1_9FIRM|nr:methyl-accepting chemotaxis protein [Heliorestis acidaminivorans]KAB2951653.1 HAMP domain-containing protein [Heliorestis acidaminivorans]